MNKLRLGLAAGAAALLAFGVAACGQTTTVEEAPATEEMAPAETAPPPAEAVDPAATPPADGAAPPAEPAPATTP